MIRASGGRNRREALQPTALTTHAGACCISNLHQKIPPEQADQFLCRFVGQLTCRLTDLLPFDCEIRDASLVSDDEKWCFRLVRRAREGEGVTAKIRLTPDMHRAADFTQSWRRRGYR